MGWTFTVLVCTGCALGLAAPARAAQEAAVEHLQVSLWPEYDRPDVLVMLDGELASEVALPATLALPIPDGVTPHAVAWRDTTGLKVANYRIETRNGHTLVSMTLPKRGFHLEYYAPLERSAGRRGYTFEWPGAVAVAKLTYEVAVPAGAADFVVKPAATSSRVGSNGLTYRMGELGALAGGRKARIEISYKKDTDTLSAAPIASSPAPPVQPAPGPAMTGGEGGAKAGSSTGGMFESTPLWPAYVAAALLIGILIGVALGRRGR